MLKSWIYYIYCGLLSVRYGWNRASEKAHWIRTGNKKHLSRLAVALTDFQKAQCFFMLAINAAAQVVIRKGGLQPQSLKQIYNTYIFIKVLAISGFLPITFTLFTLHLIDMVSWYLMLLSALSVALSVVTLVTIGGFNPSPADMNDLASSYSTGGPSSCGNVQPAAYCYTPEDSSDYYYGYEEYSGGLNTSSVGDTAFRVLGFCLVVLLLLAADKSRISSWPPTQRSMRWFVGRLGACQTVLTHITTGFQRISTLEFVRKFRVWTSISWSRCLHLFSQFTEKIRWKVSTHPTLHRMARASSRRCFSWKQSDRYIMTRNYILRSCSQSWRSVVITYCYADITEATRILLVVAIYCTFSGLYIYWFTMFSQNLAYFAIEGTYSKTWNFGQVVAITVWAPPLFEYVHLELRKSPISLEDTSLRASWLAFILTLVKFRRHETRV